MVPLKFPGFLLYVVELARVFVRYVKHLHLACYSMKHPSKLQIAMSKSSGLAEGTKGQGEDPPPLQILADTPSLFQSKGQIIPITS